MKTIFAAALVALTFAGPVSVASAQAMTVDRTVAEAAAPQVEQARYKGHRRVVRHYRRGVNPGAAAFGLAAGAIIGGAIAAHERNRYYDNGYHGYDGEYRRGYYDRGYGYEYPGY